MQIIYAYGFYASKNLPAQNVDIYQKKNIETKWRRLVQPKQEIISEIVSLLWHGLYADLLKLNK